MHSFHYEPLWLSICLLSLVVRWLSQWFMMVVHKPAGISVAWRERWSKMRYCEADRQGQRIIIYLYQDMDSTRAGALQVNLVT